MNTILVTGGLGYIGSHTIVELVEQGYEVVIIDDLSNSDIAVLAKLEQLLNKKLTYYIYNILDKQLLESVFKKHTIDAVIHFAAFKAVAESVADALKYYTNNLIGSINLLNVMNSYGVDKFIFSSTATVYGDAQIVPIDESSAISPVNPYASTKSMVEQILKDLHISNKKFSAYSLRYFNPIGCHESGLIGESPLGIPNNLMPYLVKVASGELEYLPVYGNDYPTKDGTGVRDYIHVIDLAKGHVLALNNLFDSSIPQVTMLNLGTGVGYSVLEVIHTFEQVNKLKIKYEFKPRRDGDVAKYYANPNLAKQILGFQTKLSLADMCRHSWYYQQTQKR